MPTSLFSHRHYHRATEVLAHPQMPSMSLVWTCNIWSTSWYHTQRWRARSGVRARAVHSPRCCEIRPIPILQAFDQNLETCLGLTAIDPLQVKKILGLSFTNMTLSGACETCWWQVAFSLDVYPQTHMHGYSCTLWNNLAILKLNAYCLVTLPWPISTNSNHCDIHRLTGSIFFGDLSSNFKLQYWSNQ